MKKIDFKFTRRQAILFLALLVVIAVNIWASGILSTSHSKQPTGSLKSVTERVSVAEPAKVEKPVQKTVEPQPTITESSPAETKKTEEPAPVSIYDKYGITQEAVQPFITYYPDYFAYNNDMFVQYVASVFEKTPGFNIEQHARATGLKNVTQEAYKRFEKNSFISMIVTSSSLSCDVWLTVL